MDQDQAWLARRGLNHVQDRRQDTAPEDGPPGAWGLGSGAWAWAWLAKDTTMYSESCNGNGVVACACSIRPLGARIRWTSNPGAPHSKTRLY